MSISKVILSGSTNGRPIKVAAASSPGTTIHTAHATALDEIYMYLSNTDSVDRNITVEFGGVSSPDNLLKFIVPTGETILAIAGIPLTNSLVVTVFASAANVVTMSGYVNRIS